MSNQRFLIILVVLFCSIFPLKKVFGGEHNLSTSIEVEEAYNDNIYWSSTYREKDWILTFSPIIIGEYSFPGNTLSAEVGMDIVEYKKNNELDTQEKSLKLMYDVYLTPFLQGNMAGSFLKDTAFEKEIEETGIIVNNRGDRKKYNLRPLLTWFLSEMSRLSFSYDFYEISYDDPNYIDYHFHKETILFNHKHNEKMSLLWENSYTRYDYNDEYHHFIDNYQSFLGMDYQFNEFLKLSVTSGIRYSETKAKWIDTHRREKGGLGLIRIFYRCPRSSVSFGFKKDITPSGSHGLVTHDRANLALKYWFLQELTGGLSFTWNRSESKGDLFGHRLEKEERSFSYNTTINYRLRENTFLELMYDSHTFGLERDEDRSRRDTVFLKFIINFSYNGES